MKYIVRDIKGIQVVSDNIKIINKGLIEYINYLCLQELSTYIGRVTSTKKTCKIQSTVPIYINNQTILFPTSSVRNYECYYINYKEVLSVREQGNNTVIIFDDLSELYLSTDVKKIKRQIKKCECIIDYLENRTTH